MSDKDFLKLAQAIKYAVNYEYDYGSVDKALQLLREIFNNNGGADRYLQLT